MGVQIDDNFGGAEDNYTPDDDLLAGLRTGDWLDAQVFPPTTYIVPGLIPEGMTLLVGPPKAGKSWLSLNVALAAASGGRAIGTIPVDPRPVLLLALEDGDRRMQERARKLMEGKPLPRGFTYLTQLAPLKLARTIEAWLRTLPADAEPLVILDTLGKVMPDSRPGESTYQRDYRIAGRLKALADNQPGMGLVVLHHDRKASSDDFVDAVSGTNGIAGAADTIVVISRRRNEAEGLLKITGRDVEEAEYGLTFADGRWVLMGDNLAQAQAAAFTLAQTSNLSDLSAEVLRFVNKHPEGVTPAKVAKEIEGLDSKEAAVYLHRLEEAHKVRKPSRGLYTPVVSVVSVVSEPEAPIDYNTYNTYNNVTSDLGGNPHACPAAGDWTKCRQDNCTTFQACIKTPTREKTPA